MTESYENIRDSSEIIPQEVRVKWVEADQTARTLRDRYAQLEQDADLTLEAKSRKAEELYQQQRSRIEDKKQAAVKALRAEAEFAERQSIPHPAGQSRVATDAQSLLLDQNEAARIVRTAERRKDAPGPFKQGDSDFLRQEYKRGLKLGGLEGGVLCRGVLRAAGELGISSHEVLDSSRDDRQRERLDDARRLEYFSGLIDTKAPRPPRSLQKAARTSRERFAQRTPQAVMAPASGPPMPAAEGSSSGPSGPKRAAKKRRKSFS